MYLLIISPYVVFPLSTTLLIHDTAYCQLPSGVATVSKQCLACDPATLGDEETDNRCYVLGLGEAPAESLALVESNSLGRLLWVKEGCVYN